MTQFPTWSTALFVVALALILASTVGIARTESLSAKRRIFWLGWMSAVACAAVSLLPLGLKTTIITFVGFGFAVVFWAWLTTPYLKVGGRTLAFTLADRRADRHADDDETSPAPAPTDYPGPVSAPTLWWVFAVLTATSSVGVYLGGWRWETIAVTVVLTALGAVCGLDDASRKLAPARGQYVQASLIGLASILLWLAPVASYALGYAVGLRRPMGKRLTDEETGTDSDS